MRARLHNSGRNGFSLLELLTVVLILAVLSAIVVPQLGIGGDVRVSAAARLLAARLNDARQRAIATGHSYRVCFDAATQVITIEAAAETPAENPVEICFGSGTLAGVEFQAPDLAGSNSFYFSPSGAPTALADNQTKPFSSPISINLRAGVSGVGLAVQPFTGQVLQR